MPSNKKPITVYIGTNTDNQIKAIAEDKEWSKAKTAHHLIRTGIDSKTDKGKKK